MGGYQNYGPFLDPYYNTGTQKGTIMLTTTHMAVCFLAAAAAALETAGCRTASGSGSYNSNKSGISSINVE